MPSQSEWIGFGRAMGLFMIKQLDGLALFEPDICLDQPTRRSAPGRIVERKHRHILLLAIAGLGGGHIARHPLLCGESALT
jgi:hypothetical protein